MKEKIIQEFDLTYMVNETIKYLCRNIAELMKHSLHNGCLKFNLLPSKLEPYFFLNHDF